MLFLGYNRISDIAELDKLEEITFLLEITMSNNPVARKQLYRPKLLRKLPTLKFIDGREVTNEERERMELLFTQRIPLSLILFSILSSPLLPLFAYLPYLIS